MARIRSIKPEFFTSDDICRLSPLARLLYIGLWCEADREGRFEWKPRTLKRKYLPEDGCNGEEVAAELVKQGLVVLYGEGLACIPTFRKHQLPNAHEAKSKLADAHACAEMHVHRDASPEMHVGKGREGKGREASEDKSSGADAPGDLSELIFGKALQWLQGETKKSRRYCAGLLGKWRKALGDEALLAALARAQREGAIEPVAWMEAAIRHHTSTANPARSKGWN